MKSLVDFIGDQEMAALARPIGQATGLSGRVFSLNNAACFGKPISEGAIVVSH